MLLVVRNLTGGTETLARILNISKYNAHTELIFKTLRLLKVNDILKLQELKFHYKYENNLLWYYLQNLLFKTNIHSYATRSQDKIHHWVPMHYYARKCVPYNIPSTVNNTPINIIEKVYTHIVYKVSQNILNWIYYNHTRKIVQSMTASYVLDRDVTILRILHHLQALTLPFNSFHSASVSLHKLTVYSMHLMFMIYCASTKYSSWVGGWFC